MSQILKLVLWLAALLVVAGIFGLVFLKFAANTSLPALTSVSATGTSTSPAIQQLTADRSAGNFSAAVADYQSIMNDPSASAEEKAVATYTVAGAEFHITGNINDRLEDVRNLKQVVLDQTISPQTRATALNTLASTYGDSGNNQTVFQEIFNSPPFSSYLAPNPSFSILNLYVWSYTIQPTPVAAVHAAKLYSDSNPNLSATTSAAYDVVAEDYLNKAAAAALQDAQTDPTYPNSSQYYVQYQFWEAVVIGRLARLGIAPYTEEYQSEFTQYIEYAEKANDVQAKENLYYAYYYYAETLSNAGNTTSAKQELDTLAQELSALPNPNLTAFVLFVRNSYANHTAPNWAIIQQLTTISSAFKSAVDTIIATPPAPGSATTTASVD